MVAAGAGRGRLPPAARLRGLSVKRSRARRAALAQHDSCAAAEKADEDTEQHGSGHSLLRGAAEGGSGEMAQTQVSATQASCSRRTCRWCASSCTAGRAQAGDGRDVCVARAGLAGTSLSRCRRSGAKRRCERPDRPPSHPARAHPSAAGVCTDAAPTDGGAAGLHRRSPRRLNSGSQLGHWGR